jgi:FHS family L-fucose permease-like MFS transporter
MLAAFAFGRFSVSDLMRFVDPPKLMSAYSIMNIGLLLIGVRGWPGIWAVFLTSFFMSLMFLPSLPAVFVA